MTDTTTCPTCGATVRVVGDTTMHYEPVDAPTDPSREAVREALEWLEDALCGGDRTLIQPAFDTLEAEHTRVWAIEDAAVEHCESHHHGRDGIHSGLVAALNAGKE